MFEKMVENNDNPTIIQEQLGLKQNSNVDEIKSLCLSVVDNNPQSIIDFKNGKDRAVGFLIGQVMKQSHGKANPQIVSNIIKEILASK